MRVVQTGEEITTDGISMNSVRGVEKGKASSEQIKQSNKRIAEQTISKSGKADNSVDQLSNEIHFFDAVGEKPEFPGGDLALRKFIGSSVKYPVIAQENGIQGKVYVTFVVSKTGKVTNASIARGVDPSLDKEALRVVNALPAWKPGKQRGKPVNVSYTVPINFVLQ